MPTKIKYVPRVLTPAERAEQKYWEDKAKAQAEKIAHNTSFRGQDAMKRFYEKYCIKAGEFSLMVPVEA